MLDHVVDRNQKLQEMVDDMSEITATIEKTKAEYANSLNASALDIGTKAIEMNLNRQDRVNQRNDWIKEAGTAIKGALNTDSFDFSNMNANNGTLGDIAGNTKDIVDNTAEISEEDLSYLIDIAERETINRFTTAEVKIEMNNNNMINGEQDLDGIVEGLAIRLEEELQYVADGVHT